MIHLKTVFQEKCTSLQWFRKPTSSLPRLQYLHHVPADYFAFFQKKRNFSILLLYTPEGKVFLQCDWLFRMLPICIVWEERWLLEEILGTRVSYWNVRKNYIHHLHTNAHLILLIDNTICHKTSAHTVCGSVYGIECNEEVFKKHQDNYGQRDSNRSGISTSWMFMQIDPNIVRNKFVHAQKDLLQRLYDVFLPQVLLENKK